MKHTTARIALLSATGFVLAAALALAGCQGDRHSLSEAELKTANYGAMVYARDNGGMKVQSCSGLDSDGDGYVTCGGTNTDGTKHALLCSYEGSASGCKDKP